MIPTALYLFTTLTESDVAWMARAGKLLRFESGAPLITAGGGPDRLLVLLNGTVRVSGAGGQAIATRRRGECLGEISLVDSRLTSTNVIADNDVLVLALDGATIG